VTDLDDEHGHPLVFEMAYDTVVSYTVSPKITKRSLQNLPHGSGIIRCCDPLVQEIDDPFGNRTVKPLEVF
jgi:hypothetical protein